MAFIEFKDVSKIYKTGSGEIWFDDELIRKDGLFVTEDLKCLNPDNLK